MGQCFTRPPEETFSAEDDAYAAASSAVVSPGEAERKHDKDMIASLASPEERRQRYSKSLNPSGSVAVGLPTPVSKPGSEGAAQAQGQQLATPRQRTTSTPGTGTPAGAISPTDMRMMELGTDDLGDFDVDVLGLDEEDVHREAEDDIMKFLADVGEVEEVSVVSVTEGGSGSGERTQDHDGDLSLAADTAITGTEEHDDDDDDYQDEEYEDEPVPVAPPKRPFVPKLNFVKIQDDLELGAEQSESHINREARMRRQLDDFEGVTRDVMLAGKRQVSLVQQQQRNQRA